MKRILTGVQSTGVPHLGNILGAIEPAINMSNNSQSESFLFIADLHSLTQIKNGKQLRENTYSTASVWLAFGLNPQKVVFYRQSDVPQVTELAWYLSCYFPYQRLTLAHSFKDKSDRLSDVNTGLFTYPMLMAADILAYDADEIPVGKDQLQHIEMTRDVASRINHTLGDIFVVPNAKINEKTNLVLGTDGEKMSKSRNNFINIFLPEKQLKKQINSIITDSTPLEEPKNPDSCNAFKLYSLLANKDQMERMKKNYLAGGYGFGHAKKEIFDLILQKYSKQRSKFDYFMSNKKEVDSILFEGAKKASKVSNHVINRFRKKIGF